jgi:hypothetical protein
VGQRARPGVGFGQGPVVRGGRRLGEQRLGDRARDALVASHAARDGGRWAEAAPGFEKSAMVCRDRGMTRSATWLGTLAAECRARAGDAAGAVAALEAAIGDARADGDKGHSAQVFGELLAALAGTPLAGAVADLERAIRDAVGVAPKPPGGADVNRTLKRTLPATCDTCGTATDAARARRSEDGADCHVCGAVL